MTLHNHELFGSREAIPDVVPCALLTPPARRDLRVPRAARHSPLTTTPVEVGYFFFRLGAPGFSAQKQQLEIYQQIGSTPENFLEDTWGNHLGRVVVKIMLDPDRLAPINMNAAYRSERVQYRSPAEEKYLEDFTRNWGVLER